MRSARGLLPALCLAALAAAPLAAHPVSVIELHIELDGDELLIELGSNLEDLLLFHALRVTDPSSGQGLVVTPAELARGLGLHRALLRRGIRIIGPEGTAVSGTLRVVSALPERAIATDELADHPLRLRLRYTLPALAHRCALLCELKGRQRGINVSFRAQMPRRSDDASDATPQQLSEGVLYPLLPGATVSSVIDADGRELRVARPHEGSRRGFCYLTLDQQALRHEFLLPFLPLDRLLALEREDPAYLSEDEQERLREHLPAVLERYLHMQIDGVAVAPLLSAISLHPLGGEQDEGFGAGRIPTAVLQVGCQLSYPLKRAPESLLLRWRLFPPPLERIFCSLTVDGERSQHELDQRDGELAWRGSLTARDALRDPPPPPPERRLPLASIALALVGLALAAGWRGAGTRRRLAVAGTGAALALAFLPLRSPLPQATATPVDADRALATFADLHHNIFRALDYPDRRRAYRTLSNSVAEPLCGELFLELQAQILRQHRASARMRIDHVQLGEQEVLQRTARAFTVRSVFLVDGAITHWGHRHRRRNRYQASFDVAATADGWRIVGMHGLQKWLVSSTPDAVVD